jgi:hypothetical protein
MLASVLMDLLAALPQACMSTGIDDMQDNGNVA